MSSAYPDALGRWIADFRGLLQAGRQHRTTRVPRDQLRQGHEDEDAKAYAAECHRLCRLCETSGPAPANVARAEDMGAITAAQASALRLGQQPLSASETKPKKARTIMEAARMHPSSQREAVGDVRDHERAVTAFCQWASSDRLDALDIETVTGWIKHQQAQGRAYDTIRHDILWLCRASRMAGAMGFPDPLTKLVLHRRGGRPLVVAWGYEELSALLTAARAAGDLRLVAVTLLGGWCGLRPSEVQRLEVRDLADGVLGVAQRLAKNSASPRRLPLPPAIVGVLQQLCADRKPEDPIIRSESSRSTGDHPTHALTESSFPTWFARAVWGDGPTPTRAKSKTGPNPLPPRPGACPTLSPGTPETLRKSFMSWTLRRGLAASSVERWAGHTISGMAVVTERHYYRDIQVSELLPISKAIGKALAETYTPALHRRKSMT